MHLLNIRGLNDSYLETLRDLIWNLSERRPFIQDALYQKPNSIPLKTANDMLLTFVFTRQPFSRLVSAYNDKIKHGYMQYKFLPFRANASDQVEYATPREFVKYLLWKVDHGGVSDFDLLWKPQYLVCPPCQLAFDYVGDIDEMQYHVKLLSHLLGFKVSLFETHLFIHRAI